MSLVPYNKLLTNLACSSRTGEYWPSVVFVWTWQCSVQTVTTSGQYSPVRPSRSVCKRLLLIRINYFSVCSGCNMWHEYHLGRTHNWQLLIRILSYFSVSSGCNIWHGYPFGRTHNWQLLIRKNNFFLSTGYNMWREYHLGRTHNWQLLIRIN